MPMDNAGGPIFICWRGGKPPKDKKTKCSVCKRRWSSRLCDGEVAGPVVPITITTGPSAGQTYPARERSTCDAPLCTDCTTEAAPLIALPAPDSGLAGPLDVLHVTRIQNQRRGLGEKRKSVLPEPDTRDFCPTCVKRMQGHAQRSLFTETS